MSARCGALDGWPGLGEAAHRAHTVRFTPPPRPSRRPPTSAAPTRSRTARGRSRRSPGGAPARRRPPARPRLPSPARNGRPAAHSAQLPGLWLPNLPPTHLPPTLPHASDWVPVGRRRVGSATRLQHGLGWVGRAQICVWSVPAGACGLPPEAAALFLSLSAASLPFSIVVAPSVEAADGLRRTSTRRIRVGGSGRRGEALVGAQRRARDGRGAPPPEPAPPPKRRNGQPFSETSRRFGAV